jgi:ubiquinone/menaquinone biosynthesis C-methylase UbiE
MTPSDAAELIADPRIDSARWADVGCGTGVFTRALATLLPPGSVIHAMDVDRSSLRQVPASHAGTSIVTHVGDMTRLPWPFGPVDGVLLANALHYVADPVGWLRDCRSMLARRRLVVVEYDTDRGNAWVPYPLSRESLARVCVEAGYGRPDVLRMRRSIYQRAPLYAAIVDDGT